MITQPEIVALIGALLTSLLGLMYRGFIRNKEDCVLLAFWNSLAGGILLAAFLPFPGLGSIDSGAGFYLMLSGLLWTTMVYFDLRAYGSMELTLNAILNSARLAIAVVAGAALFSEPVGIMKLLGAALIVVALWITVRGNKLTLRYGLSRILAISCGTIAIGIDKYLSKTISIELILMNGYFIPAIFFAIYGMQPILARSSYSPTRLKDIFLTSAMLAGTGYCLIVPIGTGELGTTIILNQMALVFSFLFGVMLLKERENLPQRITATGLATCGALLAVFST